MNGIPEQTPEPERTMISEENALPAFLHKMESLIRKHPIAAVFTSIGFGCAVGVVAREFLIPPASPKNRALALLEDLQEHLADYTEPARERMSKYAGESVDAAKNGYRALADTKLAERFRHLFS